VRRRRAGFGFAWGGSPIPARAEIRAGDSVAGYVTSSVQDPEMESGLGMGYVTTDALHEGATLTVGAAAPTRLTILDWPL
jgi:glycine cleavage system aminomethyltransferase T